MTNILKSHKSLSPNHHALHIRPLSQSHHIMKRSTPRPARPVVRWIEARTQVIYSVPMDIKRKKPLIESWQFGQLMQRPKVDIKMGKLWQPCVLWNWDHT